MAGITQNLPGWPTPPSAAAPGAPTPNVPTYNGFDPKTYGNAENYFSQAAGYANQAVSPQSLDRASARVRNRVDTATRANEMDIRDRYAGRGMLNSGAASLAQAQNRQAGMSAYGTGLAQVQDDYNTRLLTAAQNMGSIGNYAADAAGAKGRLALDETTALNQAAVDKQNADTNRYTAENNGALDIRKFLADLTQNFAAYGNTFSDPQMLKQILASFGLDISGLQFYQPPTGDRFGADPGNANPTGGKGSGGGGSIKVYTNDNTQNVPPGPGGV